MPRALAETGMPLAHPSAPAAADFARNPRRLMLELLFMSCLTCLSASSIGRIEKSVARWFPCEKRDAAQDLALARELGAAGRHLVDAEDEGQDVRDLLPRQRTRLVHRHRGSN